MLRIMSRAAAPLAISDEQREVLETLAKSPSAAHRVVQRARTLLLVGKGVSNTRIGEVVGISRLDPVIVAKTWCSGRSSDLPSTRCSLAAPGATPIDPMTATLRHTHPTRQSRIGCEQSETRRPTNRPGHTAGRRTSRMHPLLFTTELENNRR